MMAITFSFFSLLVLVVLAPSTTSVSISVHPKTLTKSGDHIQIRWSGVPSPSPLDWLGIYSPPESPDLDFLGYLYLNSSPGWRSGSGLVDLPLVNLRSPYQFRLFRWTVDEINPKRRDHQHNPLPGTKRRLAVSADVRFASPNGPEQVHLSFADGDDEMRVLFVTGDGSESFVEYGLDEGKLDEAVGTEVRTYERGHMCDRPANTTTGWRSPGFTHDGLLKNLRKGTRYFYRVGSDSIGWSPTHSFVSRDRNSNQTIAYLFGDMGTFAPYSTYRRTQVESLSTVKWILRDILAFGDKPSLVSHIGDISYAVGYSWLWDHFFHQIEPVAASVPYHVCIGNHEYDWPRQPWKPSWSYGLYGKDSGGECGVPYSVRFHMPGNSSLPATGTGAPGTRNLYYSFDAGVVHFLYMSTETDFLPGSDQYAFIKRDLEGVDREKTPYVVFQGHRPMYTTGTKFRDAPLRERMLEHLEPLLLENNVTLALWGHVHRYERFCALRNYTCVGNSSVVCGGGAPVHLVIGMAGKETQPKWTPLANHPDEPIYPQPERSVYRGGQFGYVRLVATREKLTLTYVGNHDGQAHDQVEILSGLAPVMGDDDDDGKMAFFSGLSYAKYVGCLMLGAAIGYSLDFLVRPSRGTRSRRGGWKYKCLK